jgi:hypothetical protein
MLVTPLNRSGHQTGFLLLFTLLCIFISSAAQAACNTPTAPIGSRQWFAADLNYRLCTGTVWQLVSKTSTPYYNTSPSNQLVWLKFDETSGTSAADATGNGNTGTLTNFPGSPWLPAGGKNIGALDFDGTNDYVQLANESNFDFDRFDSYSIAAWIYRDSAADEDDIVLKVVNSTNYQGYALWLDPSGTCNGGTGSSCVAFDFANAASDSLKVWTPNNSVPVAQWVHIALTYSGTSTAAGVRIYINGVNQTLNVQYDALSSGTALNNAPVVIGADPVGPGGCCNFNGRIDDVRIFNRALTAAEVAALADGTCNVQSQMQYDTVLRKYFFCNGTAWQEATCPSGNCGSNGACTVSGALQYFTGTNEFAWCDGTNWQVMAR